MDSRRKPRSSWSRSTTGPGPSTATGSSVGSRRRFGAHGGSGGPRRSRRARGAGTTRHRSEPGRAVAGGLARWPAAPAASRPRRDRCRAGSCAPPHGAGRRRQRRGSQRPPRRPAAPVARARCPCPPAYGRRYRVALQRVCAPSSARRLDLRRSVLARRYSAPGWPPLPARSSCARPVCARSRVSRAIRLHLADEYLLLWHAVQLETDDPDTCPALLGVRLGWRPGGRALSPASTPRRSPTGGSSTSARVRGSPRSPRRKPARARSSPATSTRSRSRRSRSTPGPTASASTWSGATSSTRSRLEVEVVIAADTWYDAALAGRVLPWLRRAKAAGIDVLVGDPGRADLPAEGPGRARGLRGPDDDRHGLSSG